MSSPIIRIDPEFIPHRLLRCRHRQTVAAAYLSRRFPYRAMEHTIDLDDGDQIKLHDDCPEDWKPGDKVALLVHGLGGCHESGYMNRLAAKLTERNIRPFRMDMRGCGNGAATARYSLHAGRVEDLHAAAEWTRERCPNSPLVLIGFSLGASIVLKLLGDLGSQGASIASNAIVVSPPLDLAVCSRSLPQGVNQLYDRNFARLLSRTVETRRRLRPDLHDRPWKQRPKTLLEFDSVFTAPLGGFRDVNHYYKECSAIQRLHAIDIPTRILIAEDDPLIPHHLFEQATYSPTTQVYAAQHGGHLGFLGTKKSPDPDWHWMDWRILEWLIK